ncbi:hypothetical protein PsYK624_014910 [Phanerochaete sordida]|uniref:Uncharacterized protein n=1 Tax=Phanerochaete sordida TaxID=48140 RepID=A0A9P3FZK6_9APHY|nr:hypothetical protein PsYK624_014910 [Phanerochaete sordida]
MDPKKAQKQDRTHEWVEQQSSMRYSPRAYDPPPASVAVSAPGSVSRTHSSSTTTFSEQSSAGPSTLRRRAPPSPSHTNSVPASPHEQRVLPFPQSPPGSGYPMVMQVAAPRVEAPRPTRPSLLKKRRPSIAEQVKSFGSSNAPWKRDEPTK